MSARARKYLQIDQVRAMELAAAPPPLTDLPPPQADFPDWLYQRSQKLVELHQWQTALKAPAERYRLASLGLALVLFFLGVGTAARAVAGAGDTLNLFWILGVMLGANVLSLVLWLGFTALGGGGGPLARMLAPLVRRLMPGGSSAQVASNRAWLERRLAAAPAVFRLGAATHCAWLGYALGGLLGLLFLLATRQFNFVWESTLLGEGAFQGLTRMLGVPLAALGLNIPDAAAISLNSAPLTAGAAETARREWGLFLLGAVLLYGVLPRLLAYGICRALAHRADTRLGLDLTDPYYLRLQQSLWPRQRPPKIVDPDHAPIASPLSGLTAATAAPATAAANTAPSDREAAAAPATTSTTAKVGVKATTTTTTTTATTATTATANAPGKPPVTMPVTMVAPARRDPPGVVWLGVELGRQIEWPPASATADAVLGNMIDSDSRRAALARLEAVKSRPLTLVVDADKPADRGMLRQLRQALALSSPERAYLLLVAHREVSRSKRDDWARAVAELGISPTHVLTEASHLEAVR